jgi:hypothetical protein
MKQIENVFINNTPADYGIRSEEIDEVFSRMMTHFAKRANLVLENWQAASTKDAEDTAKFNAALEIVKARHAAENS